MASERVPGASAIPAIESSPRSDAQSHHGPLVEDNPFGSREGSVRPYASRNNSANGEQRPMLAHAHASGDERDETEENASGLPELPRNSAALPTIPSPSARYAGEPRPNIRRQRTGDTGRVSMRPYSAVDYIVPSVEVKVQQADIKHRLAPTIRIAKEERDKFALKAKWTGYALNAAIGLQVLLGSLTTGLSAAATSGKSAAVQTTILGGLSTVVASYLARSRGTNEPEKSNAMVKELNHFIRECEAFELDHGHIVGSEMDHILIDKRKQLEVLLGHTNGGDAAPPPSSKVEVSKASPV